MKPTAKSTLIARAQERAGARLAEASRCEPTFTRPSGGAAQRYVASKSKTPSGVLHQLRTLEVPAADQPQDRRETRRDGRESCELAGNMVEVSASSERAAPLPAASAAESGGVIRPFVLGKGKCPLMPAHPARARQLLRDGKAVVSRRLPFVLRLKTRKEGVTQPVILKLDPGSKTTGIATVHAQTHRVLFAAELAHRGAVIRDALTQRAQFRRARRGRKTRYRSPRFLNRAKPAGWLPPSLRHRLETTLTQVSRLIRWCPLASIACELVRFDPQLLQNPEISGVEYQQGELAGYEVREYLLEKWGRLCAYCDAKDTPLQIEYVVPKARGGSNRVSNLTIACHACNQRKGAPTVEQFLANKPARLARIKTKMAAPLADAAAVNATRHALVRALQFTGLPVITASGGRTKFNRMRLRLPKSHALDAACVGDTPQLRGASLRPLSIRATGRGSRQRTRLTAHGFPRGYLSPAKAHFGFRTGDLVRAFVPAGKKAGVHFGRVAVRASGSFNIQSAAGTVQGIAHRHCVVVQRAEGYNYSLQKCPTPQHSNSAASARP